MMIRKPLIATFAALTVATFMIAESHPSDAQFFPRLRNRIQSRRITPPVPTDRQPRPAARPGSKSKEQPAQRPGTQPNASRNNPQRGTNQPAPKAARTPRRVSPVNPVQPRAVQPRPSAPGYSANRSANGRATGPTAAKSREILGPSILSADTDSAIAKEKGSTQHKAALGIRIVQSRQGVPGMWVTGMNPGSHAGQAGLRVGDLIVSVEGQPTRTTADISRMLNDRQPGEKLRINIVRDRVMSSIYVPLMGNATGEPTIAATTAVNPAVAPLATAPLAGAPLATAPLATAPLATDEAAKNQSLTTFGIQTTFGMGYTSVKGQRGAVVTEIQKDSPASASGLKTGDRIVAVEGRLLISADALQQTLADNQENFPVNVRMIRDGKLLSAKIDPNAKASSGDTLVASEGELSKNGKKKSTIGGFGAMLGGLLKGKSKPNKPIPKPQPEDAMALGDDEGVRQVDFESKVKTKAKKEGSTDPLALQTLKPPPTDDPIELLPPKLDSEKSPEELKREIKELEQRLKELEAKQ